LTLWAAFSRVGEARSTVSDPDDRDHIADYIVRLFDDIHRQDLGPAAFAESGSEYLNRSARPEYYRIRTVLEEWFSHYPDSCRSLLRTRFRGQERDDHLPAFFELFVHQVLIRLGCSVDVLDVEGRDEGRRPDFLVECPGHGSFYLEATVVTEKSEEDRAEDAITQQLYDQLNSMLASPNFFLSITVYGAPASSPSARKIVADLSGKLAQLDPDAVSRLYEAEGLGGLPTWSYPHEGCLMVFVPIPKAPAARGRPGLRPLGMMGSGEATLVESARFIKRKVNRKATPYGRLDLPYVVAVNALGDYADYEDFDQALFGQPRESLNGAFSPDYRRVSAVLGTLGMRPSHVTRAGLQLYHNPWALMSYECSLNRLPRVLLGAKGPEGLEGEAVADIVGLPPEWPKEPQNSPAG
jgi:hypothetical protein